jgi:hypothetical protein
MALVNTSSFLLAVTLYSPYFCFRSVLPIYRRVLKKYVKWYKRHSANTVILVLNTMEGQTALAIYKITLREESAKMNELDRRHHILIWITNLGH